MNFLKLKKAKNRFLVEDDDDDQLLFTEAINEIDNSIT